MSDEPAMSEEEEATRGVDRRRVLQLLVGGSAGTAVVAALRIAARADLDGPVVALLPDSWDRYLSLPWMSAT